MRAATLFSQVIDFPAFSSTIRGEPPGSGSETLLPRVQVPLG